MAITVKNLNEHVDIADVRVSEGATYSVMVTRIRRYVSASLEVNDLDDGPQWSAFVAEADDGTVPENVRTTLSALAAWTVENLSGWRVCEALQTIGEAVVLAD